MSESLIFPYHFPVFYSGKSHHLTGKLLSQLLPVLETLTYTGLVQPTAITEHSWVYSWPQTRNSRADLGSIYLLMKDLRRDSWRKQEHLPAHSSREHREVSKGIPGQPGLVGKEVRHSRRRSLTPSPHVVLHWLHGCHSPQVSARI